MWFREQECTNVTQKKKQNGRKGPRVMGMIMYASCRAGSSSSVGTKPFRKSLLFQKSFETLQKSSPWTLQLFSHCFLLSICTFVSLPLFYQCSLTLFFLSFFLFCVNAFELYGSHRSPIFVSILDAKKVFVMDTDARCSRFVRLFQAPW